MKFRHTWRVFWQIRARVRVQSLRYDVDASTNVQKYYTAMGYYISSLLMFKYNEVII